MQLSKQQKQLLGQLMAHMPKKPAAVKNPRKQNSRGSQGAQSRGNSAPVAQGYTAPPTGMKSLAPSRQGSEVRVVGCDYFGSVSAQTTVNDTVLTLSPLAANTTFPRLGAIASVFGKYAWNKIKLYVVGKAASTLAGDMTSVPVYDGGSYGSVALTEAQVKNRDGRVTSKFWENHVMTVDCKKATVPWFTLNQAQTADTDTNNFGFIHFFTEAVSSATAVADLFVEYDIEFCEGKASSDTD